MPPRQVVLASTSRYRRALMDQLGIPYEALAPLCDEEAEKERFRARFPSRRVDPALLAAHLAAEKAESLSRERPEAVIIGSDQVADLDGEILSKPGTEENAVAQLLRLAGRAHRLVTAVALHDPRTGRTEEALDIHVMRLRPFTEAQARAYVAKDRPLDCAGSYKVESRGIALVEAMEGRDYTAVIGLPLTRVVDLLARLGVEVP